MYNARSGSDVLGILYRVENPKVAKLLQWIARTVPRLFADGERWRIVIDCGPGGITAQTVIFEEITKTA